MGGTVAEVMADVVGAGGGGGGGGALGVTVLLLLLLTVVVVACEDEALGDELEEEVEPP